MENFDFWHARLRGEKIIANADDPQPGYYRDGHDAACWRVQEDGLTCWINNNTIPETDGIHRWNRFNRTAVTYDQYLVRIEKGHWPDEAPELLGHNRPPAESDIDGLKATLEDHIRDVAKLLKEPIASEEIADQVSDWSNRFGEIEKRADTLRKAEKEPFDKAAKEVQAKWTPLIERAKECKDRLKAHLTIFRRAQVEAAKKAQEEAIAAGVPAEEVPQPKTTSGSLKRTTALRSYYKAEIVDQDALYAAIKNNPDLQATMQKIADAAARNKIAMPGCKIIEDQRVA